MPGARVHARRDHPLVASALLRADLEVPDRLPWMLHRRHRFIDAGHRPEGLAMHFPPAQAPRAASADGPAAAREQTLAAVRALVGGATEALASARAEERPPERRLAIVAAVGSLTAMAHVVRDSYSLAYAVRSPGPGGPVLVGPRRPRELERASRGIGGRDLRFKAPFAWFAPEVTASDVAVDLALRAVADAAGAAGAARAARLEAEWALVEAACFAAPAPAAGLAWPRAAEGIGAGPPEAQARPVFRRLEAGRGGG